jgi:hypothetical protein
MWCSSISPGLNPRNAPAKAWWVANLACAFPLVMEAEERH